MFIILLLKTIIKRFKNQPRKRNKKLIATRFGWVNHKINELYNRFPITRVKANKPLSDESSN